nr:TSUP family transporter [Deinococcus cellulosilyticus]
MPDLDLVQVLSYGIPLAFLAGLIDAIAGGGGVITLPTLIFMGLSPGQVVATNKLLAIFGSASSTYQYFRKGKIELNLVWRLAIIALLGSALGAQLVLGFKNQEAFRMIIAGLIIVVGILVVSNKRMGMDNHYEGLNRRTMLIGGAGALLIGMYDGFFGPGTGTFLMFLFVRYLKFDFVVGSGNARFINFITNLGAFITFLISGQMVWAIGLAMGVANALGATLGARLAILKGSTFVKVVYLLIVLLVVARLTLGA